MVNLRVLFAGLSKPGCRGACAAGCTTHRRLIACDAGKGAGLIDTGIRLSPFAGAWSLAKPAGRGSRRIARGPHFMSSTWRVRDQHHQDVKGGVAIAG